MEDAQTDQDRVRVRIARRDATIVNLRNQNTELQADLTQLRSSWSSYLPAFLQDEDIRYDSQYVLKRLNIRLLKNRLSGIDISDLTGSQLRTIPHWK